MKAALVTSGLAHQREACAAMRRGLVRHGVACVDAAPGTAFSADIAVTWGWRNAAPLRAAGRNVLVMERGYIGDLAARRQWTSLGWNGLNGRAAAPPAPDAGARWRRNFGARLEAWREHGAFVVVMGQVPGDASIDGVDMAAWYRAACKASRRFGLPVRFREHPSARQSGMATPVPLGVDVDERPLAECLADARFVVTFNSNSATDAVLAGIPALACDAGSIAWPVTGHGLAADPPSPDRTRWAADIAWRQWTTDEIESGAAWEFVRHGLDDRHQAAG